MRMKLIALDVYAVEIQHLITGEWFYLGTFTAREVDLQGSTLGPQ